MAVIFAFASACSYAANQLFIRRGRQSLSANLAAICTLIVDNICNAILLIILWFFGKLVWPHPAAIPFFIMGGFFANFLGRITLFPTINYLGAARSGILGLSSPVATLVLGVFLLHERPTPLVLCGLLVVLTGLFFIAFEQEREQNASNAHKKFIPVHFTESYMPAKWVNSNYFYVALGIASGLLFGIGSFWRKIGLNISSTIIPGVAIGSLTSLIVAVIYAKLTDKNLSLREIPNVLRNKNYVAAGIFTACAQYMFFTAMSLTMVSIANMIKSTTPLFTMLFGRLFLQKLEAISKRVLLYGLIVMIGAILIVLG